MKEQKIRERKINVRNVLQHLMKKDSRSGELKGGVVSRKRPVWQKKASVRQWNAWRRVRLRRRSLMSLKRGSFRKDDV